MPEAKSKPKVKKSGISPLTVLSVAFLSVLLLGFFNKVCFESESISRLCILAEWDSVFDDFRSGRAQPFDPSLVQIFLPDYVFQARAFSKGIFPLWNPYCGLGFPFLADIQTTVFAPLRMLFNFMPDLGGYNAYLVLEVFVCLLASFWLARLLGFGRLISIFAATTYTFCPYNLWYLELNTSAAALLFPLTAAAFVQAGKSRTFASAAFAGLASALIVISGHPECSFFGVVLSSLLLLLIVLFEGSGSFLQRIFSGIKLLLIAAVVAFGVAAPVLLPFGEYLLNCQSYKYGPSYSTPVSWQGILFNLASPGQGGASPFLGIAAVLLMPFSLAGLIRRTKEKGQTACLLILALISFVLVSQLGPVQQIFSKAPFTALITRYALSYLLMLFALLAALGLEQVQLLLTQNKRAPLSKLMPLLSEKALGGYSLAAAGRLCLWLIGFLIFPLLVFSFSNCWAADPAFMKAADFDAMLPPTKLNFADWKRDLLSAAILSFAAFIAFLSASKKRHLTSRRRAIDFLEPACLFVPLVLLLGFVSEAAVAKHSLPPQSKFFYPETELLSKLKDPLYRMISCSQHVLRPASNAVYSINSLCVHNPLFPSGFLPFVKAAGAKTDMFNQRFESPLSPMLDLASVKYILALDDIEDAAGKSKERFRLVYTSKNLIRIYENKNALPRAYLVRQALPVASPEEALAGLSNPDFKPQKQVFIEALQSSDMQSSDAPSLDTPSRARNLSEFKGNCGFAADASPDDPNRVCLSASSDSASWLVLTDVFYPGWKAYIDGVESKIYRANSVFRAVHLSPGKHSVVFAYQPLSFFAGAACSLLLLILLAIASRLPVWKSKIW